MDEIQEKLKIWRFKNFGVPNATHQLMGIVEEIGELCHAKLKYEQNIRGYDYKRCLKEMKDAIGDIVIFLMGFCDVYNWSLYDIVKDTSKEVLKRDWRKNSYDGTNKCKKNRKRVEEIEDF